MHRLLYIHLPSPSDLSLELQSPFPLLYKRGAVGLVRALFFVLGNCGYSKRDVVPIGWIVCNGSGGYIREVELDRTPHVLPACRDYFSS